MMHRRSAKNHAQKKGKPPAVMGKEVMRDENPRIPPQLTDQLSVGFVLRFVTTSNWAGSYTVTYANLLDAWFIAGTATTAYQLFDFVKIKKVVVRAMGQANYVANPTISPSATVSVEFPGLIGGQFCSGKQRTGSAVGLDEPAFVSLKPDRLSQVAQFQPSTANAAVIVRAIDGLRLAVAGAIIDIHVAFKNSGDINPASVTTARAGLTAGLIYFGGIDGLATANTVAKSAFIPIA